MRCRLGRRGREPLWRRCHRLFARLAAFGLRQTHPPVSPRIATGIFMCAELDEGRANA